MCFFKNFIVINIFKIIYRLIDIKFQDYILNKWTFFYLKICNGHVRGQYGF
jgi:hypothetical protein